MTKGITELGTELLRARAAGTAAGLALQDLPTTAAEAYQVSLAQMGQIAAWKIGGANPWSQAVFNNAEVFFGPLHPAEVLLEAETLSLAGLNAPLAEPEVMFEIADPQADDPAQRFARMGLGFEIPAAVLPEGLKPQLMGQIVDRAGAGLLWVGGICAFDAAVFETPFDAAFGHNAAAPVAGTSANIIGGPLGAAESFLHLAARYQMPLEAGQWIASGGLCPAVPVQPGDQLRLSAWGQEITVSLT